MHEWRHLKFNTRGLILVQFCPSPVHLQRSWPRVGGEGCPRIGSVFHIHIPCGASCSVHASLLVHCYSLSPDPDHSFMLCLASDSSCDVCLDAFDNDLKVPCVLDCGHVFCLRQVRHLRLKDTFLTMFCSCITRVDPLVCPLCRDEFDPHRFIKMYGIQLPTATAPLHSDSDVGNIRKAISDVINLGTRQTEVQRLVASCKTFVRRHGQVCQISVYSDRCLMCYAQEYEDLRNCCHLLMYLCNVQTKSNENVKSFEEKMAKSQASEGDLRCKLNDAQASVIELLRWVCDCHSGKYLILMFYTEKCVVVFTITVQILIYPQSRVQKEEIEDLRHKLACLTTCDEDPRPSRFQQCSAENRLLHSRSPRDAIPLTMSPVSELASFFSHNSPTADGEGLAEQDVTPQDAVEVTGLHREPTYSNSLEVPRAPITQPSPYEEAISILDTPMPSTSLGLLSRTAPKDESLGSHSRLLTRQMLHELLSDERPSSLPALPVSASTPERDRLQEESRSYRKKRDKRHEKKQEVDTRPSESHTLSVSPRKETLTQEIASSPVRWETSSCDYFPISHQWHSVPSNSALFSHAPPEASQSYTAPREGRSSRRSSKSKDVRQVHRHHFDWVDTHTPGTGSVDVQRIHRHSTDGSGSMPHRYAFAWAWRLRISSHRHDVDVSVFMFWHACIVFVKLLQEIPLCTTGLAISLFIFVLPSLLYKHRDTYCTCRKFVCTIYDIRIFLLAMSIASVLFRLLSQVQGFPASFHPEIRYAALISSPTRWSLPRRDCIELHENFQVQVKIVIGPSDYHGFS